MVIKNIKKEYNGKVAVDIDELTLERGKIYSVLGSNGSGKSTLAKVISKIEKSDVEMEKISVGYLPQKAYAFRMSLIKNVLVNSKDKDRANKLISDLGLESLVKNNAKKLSGGELSKMALIRLMINDYDMLILDEPTSAMDISSSLKVIDIIKEYVTRVNAVAIIITHGISEAMKVSDYAIYLENGKLVEFGKTEEVLNRPKDVRTKHFVEFYGN